MKCRILLAAFEWIVFAHQGQWFRIRFVIWHISRDEEWVSLIFFKPYCLHFHLTQDPLSDKTSAHKIPFRLETVRLYVTIFTSDWNVTDCSTIALSRRLPNLKLAKSTINKIASFTASSLLFASCNSQCHICWATMGYATIRKWRLS